MEVAVAAGSPPRRETVVRELLLYGDVDSAWILTLLTMPRVTREAWQQLADRLGVEPLALPSHGASKVVAHHRLHPDDPAVAHLLELTRADQRRRAN